MSRKSKLQHQFIIELKRETKFGESKHRAKEQAREEAIRNHSNFKQVRGIYSHRCYDDYKKSVGTYVNWVCKNHSEVKNIEQARRYIPEYVDELRDKGLSEWTIHSYAYALRCAFHCEISELGITLGTRSRADVIRNRDAADSALRNDERYEKVITLAKATGARRMELLRLRREDFRERTDCNGNKTGELEVYKRGKGGIERWCLVREKKNNEQLLEEFLKSKMYENCSPETLSQYRRENARFLKNVNKKIENVDKKDIERYLAEYREERKVSDRTLNNTRAFISAFFNYLEFEDIIKCNPVRKTKPVKEIKKLKPSFTELQIEQMREMAITDREKAIIETLNTAGMRVSELCLMNIKDIENGAAVIRGKGNKERTVYFSDKALYYIKKYIDSRIDENDALFVNIKRSKGQYNRVSKGAVEKIVRDIGKKVEVRAYPHKFRRTVATRGGNKGMPIQEIQALLGHSKIDTTMIYCNVADANVQMSHRKYIA